MVRFPGFASYTYVFRARHRLSGGCPHSEIYGSEIFVSATTRSLSQRTTYLHRLSAPRHPPNTLKALDRSHYRYPPARNDGSISQTRTRPVMSLRRIQSAGGQALPRLRHAVRLCDRTAAPIILFSSRCQELAGAAETPTAPQISSSRARSSELPRVEEFPVASPAGGARRNRTDDLLLAKQALSQLSYGPGAGGGRPGRPIACN